MVREELLRIGEVASRVQVSVDTIRFYESKGLLQGVTQPEEGSRRFRAASVDRIRVIKRAAAIGFSLDELTRIFQRRAAGHAPCGHVLDSAKQKLRELDDRIREMHALRENLAEVIASWEITFHQTAPGGLAFLLESLIDKGEQHEADHERRIS